MNLFNNAIILMLHRIGLRSPNRIPANQNMFIEPDELLDFIYQAQNNGWTFISLDELVEIICLRKSTRKLAVLTFDDGYLDNYEHAYPILDGLKVPFCVYVTSGFIEGAMEPWWYRLERAVSLGPRVVDPFGSAYSTRTLEEMNLVFMRLRRDFMSSQEQYERFSQWLDLLAPPSSIDLHGRLFMTWEELGKISTSNLVTIGAHSHTHPVLATLSDDMAYHEIERSKKVLCSHLERDIRHFAFPFGGLGEITERDIRFVKEIGFSSAVTALRGGIRTNKAIDLFALPRVFFSPTLSFKTIQLRLLQEQVKRAAKSFVRLF